MSILRIISRRSARCSNQKIVTSLLSTRLISFEVFARKRKGGGRKNSIHALRREL